MRVAKHRSHSRMGHISFQNNMRSGQWLRGIGKPEVNCENSSAGRLGSDLFVADNNRPLLSRPCISHDNSHQKDKEDKKPSREWAISPASTKVKLHIPPWIVTEIYSTTLSCGSGLYIVFTAPFAGAVRIPLLTRRREHVIVHADHHGNENNRVVEKMQFHAGEIQLQHAARYRLVPEVVMSGCLVDEQEVLNVMPELDHQSNRPPCERPAGKTFTEDPNSDQHYQSIAVVQGFGLNEPRPKQPKKS